MRSFHGTPDEAGGAESMSVQMIGRQVRNEEARREKVGSRNMHGLYSAKSKRSAQMEVLSSTGRLVKSAVVPPLYPP